MDELRETVEAISEELAAMDALRQELELQALHNYSATKAPKLKEQSTLSP